MSAEVTIHVDPPKEPVLTVPLQAVVGGAEGGPQAEGVRHDPGRPAGAGGHPRPVQRQDGRGPRRAWPRATRWSSTRRCCSGDKAKTRDGRRRDPSGGRQRRRRQGRRRAAARRQGRRDEGRRRRAAPGRRAARRCRARRAATPAAAPPAVAARAARAGRDAASRRTGAAARQPRPPGSSWSRSDRRTSARPRNAMSSAGRRQYCDRVDPASSYARRGLAAHPIMPAIVHVIDLVKNYYLGDVTVHVLKGLNLSFDEGDFVALMGPSGSGKSTLLNLLGCLDRPTSGQYFLGDEDVADMDDDQLSEVRSTLPRLHLPVVQPAAAVHGGREHRAAAAVPGRAGWTRRRRQRCIALAEMVGLGDRLDHRPLQLSGGQQQRVAIARSAGQRPARDPGRRADRQPRHAGRATRSCRCSRELNQAGKTIIMVTHENDIAAWARRVVRLRDGRDRVGRAQRHPRGRGDRAVDARRVSRRRAA